MIISNLNTVLFISCWCNKQNRGCYWIYHWRLLQSEMIRKLYKMIYILLSFVYWVGFSFGSVSIGLRSTPGWTWSSGEPMSVSHAHVKSSINNYDGAMHPCSHNFCGVLYVVSTVDLELFDNCCNNIPRSYVCSTESLK